jgi:hypothetical protein
MNRAFEIAIRPVGRNKLAQFRQPYGKRTAAMPELRRLVPAYIFRPTFSGLQLCWPADIMQCRIRVSLESEITEIDQC